MLDLSRAVFGLAVRRGPPPLCRPPSAFAVAELASTVALRRGHPPRRLPPRGPPFPSGPRGRPAAVRPCPSVARLARAASAAGLGVPRRSKAPAAKAVGESGRGFAALFCAGFAREFSGGGFPAHSHPHVLGRRRAASREPSAAA